MASHLTAVVEPVLSELLSTWGVPGLLAAATMALVIGGGIWFVKASSGLNASQGQHLDWQTKRIDSLAVQLAEMTKERDTYRESYLAEKYPGRGHQDVAAKQGMDPVAKEGT